MKNWKTSLAGVSILLNSALGILQHFNDNSVIDVTQHVAEIITGLGFLVAKDGGVTGGTRRRNSMTDSERGFGHGVDTK